MKTEPRYDVLIYEIATRKVDEVAGTDLPLNTGTYNAERRVDTVAPRLNDSYNVGIFPAGKYKVDSILDAQDEL